MSKYRFKTRQEFITEYGSNWRHPISNVSSFINSMDHLLGTEIDINYYRYLLKDDKLSLDDNYLYFRIPTGRGTYYGIYPYMIKKVIKVDYNDKNILVYD